MRWRFWLLVCCLLGLGATVQAQMQVSVMYLAHHNTLEPVALYHHQEHRFLSPPSTSEAQKVFLTQFFKPLQEFSLYGFGELKNLFQSKSQGQAPLCSLNTQGQRAQAAPSGEFLAFSEGFPGVKQYIGTYPTSKFNNPVKKLALNHYRQAGIKNTQGIVWGQIRPFTLKNGTQILIPVESHIPGSSRDCPQKRGFSLFEKVGRNYVTRFKAITPGCRKMSLISSFATGQQVDKILFKVQEERSHRYEIYQSNAKGHLVQIFKSAPLSCSL